MREIQVFKSRWTPWNTWASMTFIATCEYVFPARDFVTLMNMMNMMMMMMMMAASRSFQAICAIDLIVIQFCFREFIKNNSLLSEFLGNKNYLLNQSNYLAPLKSHHIHLTFVFGRHRAFLPTKRSKHWDLCHPSDSLILASSSTSCIDKYLHNSSTIQMIKSVPEDTSNFLWRLE